MKLKLGVGSSHWVISSLFCQVIKSNRHKALPSFYKCVIFNTPPSPQIRKDIIWVKDITLKSSFKKNFFFPLWLWQVKMLIESGVVLVHRGSWHSLSKNMWGLQEAFLVCRAPNGTPQHACWTWGWSSTVQLSWRRGILRILGHPLALFEHLLGARHGARF